MQQITGLGEDSRADKIKRIERMVEYALTGMDEVAVDIEVRKWKKRMINQNFDFKREAKVLAKAIMANKQGVESARKKSTKNVLKSVTAGTANSILESVAS